MGFLVIAECEVTLRGGIRILNCIITCVLRRKETHVQYSVTVMYVQISKIQSKSKP